ncbi:MAG: SigB/SigF/SigG family RNA polymerase sigma factor [Christensenellaceae bacterium]|jgi:RNA polymerase sporulation-specific sigma factor|nr:SigB/SigF/SigG family RNA polymerase sigma factor [Christensenellaceae bacterium]
MLKGEEILNKIKEAKAGIEASMSSIIENNMPLIKSIVRRYRNRQIEYEDLIQLGTLGLIKAVKNFDETYGVCFSTYAVPMITGEIKRFIRDDGVIKVSRATKWQAIKINKYIEEYRHSQNREPDINHLAEVFFLEPTEIVFILESAKYPISIYAENDDDGLTLAEKIVAKGSLDDIIDKMVLKEMIKKLPEREKKIILLRYFRDKTQSEVANELNISQVQVSRIETKILLKMRDAFSTNS